MSIYKLHNELNDYNFSSIKSIQLGLLDPEKIRKGAVCDILYSDTYEGGVPKINGLFDPRMGITDKNNGCCTTCGCYNDICPGHFGKIELALPFFNINTIDYVRKLLKCVCFRCSNLLVDKNNPKLLEKLKGLKGLKRFSEIYNESTKIKKCNHNNACFKIQPKKYEKLLMDKISSNDSVLLINAHLPSEAIKSDNPQENNIIKVRPLDCLNIFKRISDEDIEFLGFNVKTCRPEWMLLTVLPVPPPSVRPAAIHDNDVRAEDDLTHLLNNIVKSNNILKTKISENVEKKQLDSHIGLVQYHLISFINNEISGIPPQAQRSSRSLKGLTQRLKQKEGRVRSNLMGKRVDYSGRTVISVDPNIDIDEYGIPIEVAMTLTFPEHVTKFNLNKLNVLLKNGPNRYPGIKRIKKKEILDNNEISYSEYSLNVIDISLIKLEIGDIVYRHLLDGDIGLFNRQPTLHRMGMMAHKIKVLPGSTFRLNVTTTTPYNADFDGDEMNAHLPQSYISKTELENIALVPTQTITPGKSKPVIGIIQDTLAAIYCFTRFDINLTKNEVINLFSFDEKFILPEHSYIKDNIEYWSAKNIFSLILPNISLNMKNNSEDTINIEYGKLIEGFIDKKIIGDAPGGLIHLIYNSYNDKVSKKFMDDIQKIMTRWFENYSLSFSLGDASPKNNVIYKMEEYKRRGLANVDEILYQVNYGIYHSELDKKYLHEKIEVDIKKKLEEINQNCAKELKQTVSPHNNLFIQITSGAKGKLLNMRQISGIVGQQDIWGKRISFNYTNRTLPHFSKFDYSAKSKGFVKNSFLQGMEPYETFFHAMGGRVGVIDTAVKTAGVGYVSRRLVKALEDVSIKYDFTVRNANNNIIQFAYGDDNMDATSIEKQKLIFIEYNNKKMLEEFYYNINDKNNDVFEVLEENTLKEFLKKNKDTELIKNEYEFLLENRDIVRNKYFKKMKTFDLTFSSPINLFRIINNIKDKFKISISQKSDLSPIYIIESIDNLINSFMKYIREKDSMILLKLLIKSLLSTKKCIYEYRFTKIIFNHTLEIIKDKIYKSFVQPGECVGIIVEQSYYEELQQATLNTFHTAGTGHSVTQGVERFSEIINVSKNLKSPQMTIYLLEEFSGDLEKADFAKSQIEYTKMKDIVLKTSITYNNKENDFIQNEDYEFIKVFQEFNNIIKTDMCKTEDLSNWILNFEFDKNKIINKNLTLIEIRNIITNSFQSNDSIRCIINDDNSMVLNMILQIREDTLEEIEPISFLQNLEERLLSLTLHGIKNIDFCDINSEKRIVYNENGNYDIKEEYLITTFGTNLSDVLTHPMVDKYRTITNEIFEIIKFLGVEACRDYLVREFNIILEDKIVYRHHALLADTMLLKGELMQIARYGINKSTEYTPFSKASFEEVVDVLIKASTFGESDHMKGVSSNIMTTQPPKIGTNAFDILLDEELFFNNEFIQENNSNNNNSDNIETQIDNIYQDIDQTTDNDFESNINISSEYKLLKKNTI